MSHNLITIANFTLPVEANLAKAKLKSKRIESFLLDEHTVGMDFAYSQALGGVKLQVRKTDARRAAEILTQGYRAQSGREKYDDKFRRGIAWRQRFVLAVVIVVFLVTLAVMVLI